MCVCVCVCVCDLYPPPASRATQVESPGRVIAAPGGAAATAMGCPAVPSALHGQRGRLTPRWQQVAPWSGMEGDFLMLNSPQELLVSLCVVIGAGQCDWMTPHGHSCPFCSARAPGRAGSSCWPPLHRAAGWWPPRVSCLSSLVTVFLLSAGFWVSMFSPFPHLTFSCSHPSDQGLLGTAGQATAPPGAAVTLPGFPPGWPCWPGEDTGHTLTLRGWGGSPALMMGVPHVDSHPRSAACSTLP